MNSVARTSYQNKAHTTRTRRQAAGRYARPTAAQDAAFRKSIARNGLAQLSAEECELLATHPWLSAYQQRQYAELAHARGQEVSARKRTEAATFVSMTNAHRMRAERIEVARQATAAFLGVDDGEIIFA